MHILGGPLAGVGCAMTGIPFRDACASVVDPGSAVYCPAMAETAEPAAGSSRSYKYYDLVMAAFVTVLLCANLIGAGKVASLEGFVFGAGVLFFPISYVFGDVLTEVYGYARARKVVWAGFGSMIFASFMTWAVLAFPPAPGWPHQQAFETVFGGTPRIVGASMLAYSCGEFCNSYVLARMKVRTAGRWLWARTVGSTIVGEAVDSWACGRTSRYCR